MKTIYTLLLGFFFFSLFSSAASESEDPPRRELYGDDPQSVFVRAARDGDLALMASLLAHEDIQINRAGLKKGNTAFTSWPPLWEAARMGRTDAVLWLLEIGASVSFIDPPRNAPQPITSAILHNDLRMLRALLEAGERPLPSGRINWAVPPQIVDYPRLAAVTYDRVECLQLMHKYGITVTGRLDSPQSRPIPLFLNAVNAGATRTVAYLLELGEDPNQTDLQIPAITIAAGSGSVETLKLLLAAGAEVNAVTTLRGGPVYATYTPLIRAVEMGDLAMVNALLAAGADVSVGNHLALYHASLRGEKDVYDRLLSAGSHWMPRQFYGNERKRIYTSVETDKIEGLGRLSKDFKSLILDKDTAGEDSSNVRLAVLPGKGASTAAALLQVRLSNQSGFELLEREALDRIVNELQLERAQLMSSDYSRVLALTPAEYVVVLTGRQVTQGGLTEFVWAELVSIASAEVAGAWLIKVSGPEFEQEIGDLATQVARLVAQISSEEGQARVVLESIRHNDVGMEARKLENELNSILRNWLACDPSVRLLERHGIAHVLREQTFGGRPFELDAGGAVISGGVDPLAEGGYRLRLRITNPEGTEVDFEVTGREMSSLVAEAYPHIIATVGTETSSTFDREQEAIRLLKQAKWAGNAQLHREAIRLADAAWALHPNPGALAEDRLKMRDQLLAQRLDALSRELKRIKPPSALMLVPDHGHARALDSLSFYEMDLEEDALLDLLETSFGLIQRIAETDPKRIIKQREMYEKMFLRLGHAISLFAPIHRQEANAHRLRSVKRRGREAARALYDIEWEPGLTANPLAASPQVWRQMPFLFDPESLPSLYLEHLSAMEEEAYFLSVMGRGLPRNYANIKEVRSSNTPYPSRPLFPRTFWQSLPGLLSEETGWMARVKTPALAAAIGPRAIRQDLGRELKRLALENPTVPGIYHAWGFAKREQFLPPALVKELREIANAQEEFQLYGMTDAPGYVEIDRQLAIQLERQVRGNPDMHKMLGPRGRDFERFMHEHPDLRAIQAEENEGPVLQPSMLFHPVQSTPELKDLYQWILMRHPNNLVATENYLFMIMEAQPLAGTSNAPKILVYRMSRHDQKFEKFPLPEFLHKRPSGGNSGAFYTMGIAETGTHLMFSNPYTGGIGLYHKTSNKWRQLEGYKSGGRYGDVVAVNNRFVFLAERGSYRPADMHQRRLEQSLIVSLDPQTGDVAHLADNLRTPSRYPFEDPGFWFGNLRVSAGMNYIGATAVYYEPADSGRREISFNGGFHIETGEWAANRTMRTVSAYRTQKVIGDRIFNIHKPENLSGDGRDFVFREKNFSGPPSRIKADETPLKRLQASLFPDNAAVGKISNWQPKNIVGFDNLLAVASGGYVRFYEHADILSAIERSKRPDPDPTNEASSKARNAFPVSGMSAGAQAGALSTFHLPGEVDLSFRWIDDARVWVAIHEVSNEQFRLFRPEHDSGSFRGLTLNEPAQPVVRVSYQDALAYCAWLTHALELEAKGLRARLPTGDEWSIFARAGQDRKYPWGNSLSDVMGNYYDRSGILALGPTDPRFRKGSRLPYNHDSGFAVSAPVTSVPENEYGLHGVGGNVWEWTLERGESGEPVVRGGSWLTYYEPKTRLDFKFAAQAESQMNTIGFRVILGGMEPSKIEPPEDPANNKHSPK